MTLEVCDEQMLVDGELERGTVRSIVRDGQSCDRGGSRCLRRWLGGRHGPGHRRGEARVRLDELVDRSRRCGSGAFASSRRR